MVWRVETQSWSQAQEEVAKGIVKRQMHSGKREYVNYGVLERQVEVRLVAQYAWVEAALSPERSPDAFYRWYGRHSKAVRKHWSGPINRPKTGRVFTHE